MQIFTHKKALKLALRQARDDGKRIACVPTMGNLHNAHLALVREAQRHADIVVVSIFVNKLQFGLNEDWDKYPRTLEQDVQKLESVACDYLLYPEHDEMYPNGMEEQTRVIVPTMANILCGASRPGHFEGVTTVVTKLFNIVQPDCAVFGLKDYQQLAIIRRMVEDLCIPVEIIAGDIVREDDGLAMSSRNGFIKPDERIKSNQLRLSLLWVAEQLHGGRNDFSEIEDEAKLQIKQVGFVADYFTICNSKTLESAVETDVNITILGAMYTEQARLIDNFSLTLERIEKK